MIKSPKNCIIAALLFMNSPEFPQQEPKRLLDRDQNFYEQTPFKVALDSAYEVLDPEHTNYLFHRGVLRRSLTLIARNPHSLHRSLPANASEDLVTNWMITGRDMFTGRFISAARLPAKAIELRGALRVLGAELQNIPDWIGYIKEHLIKPDNYTTDGMPRNRFKKFFPAISYLYFADLKRYSFKLDELGGLDIMIKDYWDENPEE